MKRQDLKKLSERELEDLLRGDFDVAPPAGLLEQILVDLPGGVVDAPAPTPFVRPRRRFWNDRRFYALAAATLVTLGGAWIGFRTYRLERATAAQGYAAPVTVSFDAGTPRADNATLAPGLPLAESESKDQRSQPAESGSAALRRRSEAAGWQEGVDRISNDMKALSESGSPRNEPAPLEKGKSEQILRDAERKTLPKPAAKVAPPPPPPAPAAPNFVGGNPPTPIQWGGAEGQRIKDELRRKLRELPASSSDQKAAPGSASSRSIELQSADSDQSAAKKEAEPLSIAEEKTVTGEAPVISQTTSAFGLATSVNDEPYRDVFFESAGTNPFVDTEDDRLSTFGLDVDTASYTIARRYLRDGNLPDPDGVRVEEFVNALDARDAPPRDGQDFALLAEGAPSPFGQNPTYSMLRLALKGREVDADNRPAATLTFVVDVSGSMNQENRLGLVKKSLGLLLDELRAADRVALVVYGDRGRVLLEPTSDKERVRRVIADLVPSGSTNAGEGLELAYELAARFRQPKTINRLILCSDGVANVGVTWAEGILERIKVFADQGIELTTVGFGMGNYNDELMEKLADRGNGRYAYVDDIDEARRIFVETLTGTLLTIAAEARVQVEFDPEIVSRWRLLGYENRDIADERFRDDTVDAGEIGAGHSVSALYEIKTVRPIRPGDRLGRLTLRYASIAKGKMVEQEVVIRGRDLAASFESSSRALRLNTVAAELAEILKGSFWAKKADLGRLRALAARVAADYEGRTDVIELVELIGRVEELKKTRGEGSPQ